ncbi:MAG: DUF3048 domain-containing protein, partial [Mycobacterium sp.]|nr:DUF3048 domain-containing protein [Mycobacterium sp.]
MTRARTGFAILAISGLVMAAGCSQGSGGQPSTTTDVTSDVTTGTPPPAISPLTGQRVSHNPVVAVKIDDTANGRPQEGIDKADLVYVEQVEGGLTRLMAIFNRSLPTVQPVRSVRPSDPELALQFGHIIFVASGGSRSGIAPLDQSPLRPVINDRGGPGFSRDPSRPAPYNLRANLTRITAKTKGPKADSIGLTWSTTQSTGRSRPGRSVRTQVGGTPVRFDWNPRMHRYQRIIDGNVQHAADAKVVATPNVIVQFCRVTTYSKDRDVLGNP